jgi:anti-sigma B factor antagonist
MFEVVVSEEGTVRRIRLNGEFDLEGIPETAKQFGESFTDGFSAVEIDLRGLTFMDSSGIRALFMALRQSEDSGIPLTIVPGPPRVQRPLDTAGATELPPFRTEE